MSGIVSDALSNVLSIRANPSSAMASASDGFRVSGALFNTITSALDRKELENEARIDAQRKIVNSLEMTRVDMANQREMKALAHQYDVEMSNLGYSHQSSLQSARLSNQLSMQNASFTHQDTLAETKYGYTTALENLRFKHNKQLDAKKQKSPKNNNSNTIDIVAELALTNKG